MFFQLMQEIKSFKYNKIVKIVISKKAFKTLKIK